MTIKFVNDVISGQDREFCTALPSYKLMYATSVQYLLKLYAFSVDYRERGHFSSIYSFFELPYLGQFLRYNVGHPLVRRRISSSIKKSRASRSKIRPPAGGKAKKPQKSTFFEGGRGYLLTPWFTNFLEFFWCQISTEGR